MPGGAGEWLEGRWYFSNLTRPLRWQAVKDQDNVNCSAFEVLRQVASIAEFFRSIISISIFALPVQRMPQCSQLSTYLADSALLVWTGGEHVTDHTPIGLDRGRNMTEK